MGEDRTQTGRRYTVLEAAGVLGITVEAVRGRIKRGTLAHVKAEDGAVYVLLDTDQARPVDDRPPDKSTDQALLVARLENEVQFLREELARKDAVLLSMTEAIKAIAPPAQEAPRETPEPPTEATPQPGRVEPQTPLEGAQETRESSEMHMPEAGGAPLPHDQQRPSERPWWRRMFGG